MTQVVIPTNLGGSGIAYSDDGTGARDFRNGGHRPWLLPMVGEQIAAAQTAVTAAASTVGAASTQASSTTSLTIGTGTQNLTVETGKNIIPGMPVRIASTATPANRMDGTVTSYNAGTGALVVSVDRVNGSGTEASWRVFLTGAGISTSDVTGGAASSSITTSTTLTAASERVRPVAMTADAQSVTLPDATTLSEGGPLFVFPNTGARTFGVRDSAGTLLAAVPAGGVAECYLRDNSTAAGSWTVSGRDLAPALTVIDATLPSTLTQAVEVAVRLTDTLSLHFARNASGHPFVFAVDHSTAPATVGTAVLIVASNLTVEHAFRISATKAMFKLEGASSNVFNVTVSGATCTVSTAATAAVFDAATFTGAPLICALGANSDLFVAIDTTGGNTVRAQAVDCSGTNPSAGSSVNISALGSSDVGVSGVYRISDTTALAIYTDNSGAAGSPFSIRAVVLSLSGTTVTVGTSAGLNDVTAQGSMALANCQLSATSYIVGFLDATNSDRSAVHIGVSGTTVTFGTKFAVEVGTFGDNNTYLDGNSNRFQPLLYPLSATTALYYYGDNGAASRHVVLTNSGGTLSAGTILYGISNFAEGGNFPQASDGFLAMNAAQNVSTVYSVGVSGTALTINGTENPPGQLGMNPVSDSRFGLSGGIRGVIALGNQSASRFLMGNGRMLLWRFRSGAPPQYVGQLSPPNTGPSNFRTPVEVAPSKAALTYQSLAQNGSTTAAVKLAILEFAA